MTGLGFFFLPKCKLSLGTENKDVSSPYPFKHCCPARNLDTLEMQMLWVHWVHAVGMQGTCHDVMAVWAACCGYMGCTPWVYGVHTAGMKDARYGYVECMS